MGTPEAIARTADLGGASRDRTDDLYNAIVALSQLSYGPERARKGSGWRRLRQSESVVFCDDMPTLKCGHACSNRVTTALTGRRTVASEVLDSGLTSSAVESRRNDEQKKISSSLQSASAQCALRKQAARHHGVLAVAEEQAPVAAAELPPQHG